MLVMRCVKKKTRIFKFPFEKYRRYRGKKNHFLE